MIALLLLLLPVLEARVACRAPGLAFLPNDPNGYENMLVTEDAQVYVYSTDGQQDCEVAGEGG